MKFYLSLFAMNLKSQMQYRLSFFLTLLGQFITSFASFFGLYFMFQRIGAVDEFTYGQVLLCFSVVMSAFSLGEMVGGGLAVFPRLLGNGEFDRALVRPRGLITQVVVPHMDFTRLGLLVQSALVLAYALPHCGVEWRWDKVLTLCLMIGGGGALFFSLFLLKAACAFFTVESLDFMNVFTYGARAFGRYPFSIYGKTVLSFLTRVVPLALTQYYPLLYLLDMQKSAICALLPVVSLLFTLPCYAFFRYGVSRYKSTGS